MNAATFDGCCMYRGSLEIKFLVSDAKRSMYPSTYSRERKR